MKKNLLWIFLIISLVLCIFSVNFNVGSAVEYPGIMVIPESTWNETLTPGMNYTVSIYTNYTDDDVWSYQFVLYYDPNVLHGGINNTDTWVGDGDEDRFDATMEPMAWHSEKVYLNGTLQTRYVDYDVRYGTTNAIRFPTPPGVGANITMSYLYDGVVNGDLITTDKHPNALFDAGDFNNTIGKLGMTTAWFDYATKPPPTTSGPGILANVTFTVVGLGFSDITIGPETKLIGWDPLAGPPGGDQYNIIWAADEPDHIQHGFFCNIPQSHDVAVSLVAPSTAPVDQSVPINVTVVNEGTYDENVNLTVYYDTTVINSTTFTLEKGSSKPFSWSWNTSGLDPSPPAYTINATATVLVSAENPTGVDDDPADNTDTQTVNLQLVHDVAVVSLDAPETATVEQPVPINVTVVNEGSYDEEVTLTVYNDTTVIDSTSFTLAKGPTSNTVDFSWDTSGLVQGPHTINATAVIASDSDLSDNNKTKSIELQLRHDVAVSLVAPSNVTVANEGSYSEDVSLTVYNDTTVIDSTSFTLAKGPTSNTSSFSWDTSGLDPSPPAYTINATATVLVSAENPTGVDDDPADNTATQYISLKEVNDVAVVSVTAPLRGNVNDNVLIDVEVKNKGSFTETFNVTAYYNETAIVLPNGKNYTTVTLAPAESTTILFTWNTTGVSPGFYTIKAWASKVPDDNLFDNTYVDGTVLVTILGDVDGDGAVGTSDLSDLNEAYGSEPGDPNWDVYCDLNDDDKIDASDLFDLSKNYGNSI